MRAICKNIFREYNIPRDKPKKGRKQSKAICKSNQRTNSRTQSRLIADDCIENFSEDEDRPRYPYIQLRRSFEIPLKLVFNKSGRNVNCPDTSRNVARKGTIKDAVNKPYSEEESDEDLMPRPIKEEILTQPSEQFQLSMPCSSMSSILSSIPSIAPRMRTKISSDESSISSGDDDPPENKSRRKRTSMSLLESLGIQSLKRSRKELMARYRPLDISITKINSSPASPKKRISQRKIKSKVGKGKHLSKKPRKPANTDLSMSWPSDEEPFQTLSANKSFVCSSPKRSQIINTPSTSPSPRKRPTELDLMIELIEKENSVRNASVRKSPRKSSKRCVPGGFVELYQRSLGKAKADARFLKHDKKFGLRNGLILQILKVHSSHGVHVAEVQIEEGDVNEEKFAIVLPRNMVSQIKSDSRIEAFFDDASKPYTMECKEGDCLNIFIKPYKLLLL